MRIISALFMGAFFFSCAGAPDLRDLDSTSTYKHSLRFKVGKQWKKGTSVEKFEESISIYVKAPAKMEVLYLKTCHRDIQILKPGSAERFVYRPNDLEGNCPLEITSLNKYGKNAWAFIAFEDPFYLAPGSIQCNGELKSFEGVGLCQSREGLRQKISFNEEMRFSRKLQKNCTPIEVNGREGSFKISPGKCVYIFKGINSGKYFKLYTIGYKDIII